MDAILKSGLRKVRECVSQQNYETALAICDDLLLKYPDNYSVIVMKAKVLDCQGDKLNSLALYREATLRNPEDLFAWQGLANFYESNMNPVYADDLVKVYSNIQDKLQGVEKQKDALDKITLKLADLHLTKNNFEQALDTLQRFPQLNESTSATLRYIKALEGIQSLTPDHFDEEHQKQLLKMYQTMLFSKESSGFIKKYLATFFSVLSDIEERTAECKKLCDKLPLCPDPLDYLLNIHLQSAMEFEQKLSAEAERIISELQKISPDNQLLSLCEAHDQLVSCNWLKARQLLRAFVDKNEENVCSYVYLMYVENNMHNFSMVLDIYKKVTKLLKEEKLLDPKNTSIELRVAIEYGYALYGQGEFETATSVLHEIPDGCLQREWVLLLTNVYLEQNKHTEAEDLLSKYEGINMADRLSISGWIHFLRDDMSRAQQLLEQSVKLFGQQSIATDRYCTMFRLARVQWNLIKNEGLVSPEDCLKTLLEAAKLMPYNGQIFLYLGRFYEEVQCNNSKAMQCYKKAHVLQPTNQEINIKYCDLLYFMDKLVFNHNIKRLVYYQDELKTVLLKAVEDKNIHRSKWAWARLGLLEMACKNYTEAIVAFHTALRVDVSDSNLWESLAEAYYRRGSYTAALKTFQKVLQLNPKSLYSRYQLAVTHQNLCLYSEALSEYTSILQDMPDYIPAIKGISETHYILATQYVHELLDDRALSHCQESISHLVHGLQNNSNLCCLWKLLADCCSLTHHIPSAKLAVPGILLDKPKEEIITLNSIDTLHLAIRCYKTAIKLQRDSIPLHFDLAVTYFYLSQLSASMVRVNEANEYAQISQRLLKSILSVQSSVHTYWLALGVVSASLQIDDKHLAQHCFIKSIHLENNNAIAWGYLGLLYFIANDKHLANEAFKMAQSLEPDYIIGWLGQSLIAESIGHEESLDLFRHCLTLGNNLVALVKYGQWVCQTVTSDTASHTGSHYNNMEIACLSTAEAALSKYVGRVKNSAGAFNLLGIILERKGLVKNAMAAYKRLEHPSTALTLSSQQKKPGILEDVIASALVMYRCGDYASSYQAYETALDWCTSDTEKSQIYAAMALVSFAFGEVEATQSDLISSSNCDPTFPQCFLYLASIGVILEDYDLFDATLMMVNEQVTKLDETWLLRKLPLDLKLALLKTDTHTFADELHRLIKTYSPSIALSDIIAAFFLHNPEVCNSYQADKELTNNICKNSPHLSYYFKRPPCQILKEAQRRLFLLPGNLDNYVGLLTALYADYHGSKRDASSDDLCDYITSLSHFLVSVSSEFGDKNLVDFITNISEHIKLTIS